MPPMTWATHVLQPAKATSRVGDLQANLLVPISVRIVGRNRLHEVVIASNRGSARRGEYVPGPCMLHRLLHHTRESLKTV